MRRRRLCLWKTVPPFNLNDKVGYAGSMHDFGVRIEGEAGPETGINNTTVTNNSNKPAEIYTIDGLRLNTTVDKLIEVSTSSMVKRWLLDN